MHIALLAILACAPTKQHELEPAVVDTGPTGDLLLSATSSEGGWSQVITASSNACGLREGRIACWGGLTGATGLPEGDTFVAFDVSPVEGSVGCALTAEGSIDCWGEPATEVHTDVPEGTFSSVAVGEGLACALDTAGHATCWGGIEARGEDYHPPSDTSREALVMHGADACSLQKGTLDCWGLYFLDGFIEHPSFDLTAPLLGLSASQEGYCAWTTDTLACWNPAILLHGTFAYDTYSVSGLIDALLIDYNAGYDGKLELLALFEDGSLWFLGRDETFEFDPGPYVAASGDTGAGCGLDAEGYVTCWWAEGAQALTPP